MRQFAGENFCFELPDCEDLVPKKKICVKSRGFSQQRVVWGRGGEAASVRVAGRMDTFASSCRVAGTDRQVGSSGHSTNLEPGGSVCGGGVRTTA